jgi:hypothetical protein
MFVGSGQLGLISKISFKAFTQFWKHEMEPFDATERFFRLIKQPN